MIDEVVLKEISRIFIGDLENWYSYKTGSELVAFFNNYFGVNESYGPGFPSRWFYVLEHLKDLERKNQLDKFFSIILDKNYIQRDSGLNLIESVERKEQIIQGFNNRLKLFGYNFGIKNGKIKLMRVDDDYILIGSGGFSDVYLQKSTNLIVKKLKEEYFTDKVTRSRFKREFEITKSLNDLELIIKVFEFDDVNIEYTMEKADSTLEDYIKNNELDDNSKKNLISQLLNIMGEVHGREIIHRDLSPTNIFIKNGLINIADFGLGKDLNVLNSYHTQKTTGVGQFFYCAPEQLSLLKDGDKCSDVFSLGRVINFIMTENPLDYNHHFRSITEKGTSDISSLRFTDAKEMEVYFHKILKRQLSEEDEEKVECKISNRVFDSSVEEFLYNQSAEKLCRKLIKHTEGYQEALLTFMKIDAKHSMHIIQLISKEYEEIAGNRFESYDVFAYFALKVLSDSEATFPFLVKEIAAKILKQVAFEVNRFNAQRMIDNLLRDGLEPMIEDILK